MIDSHAILPTEEKTNVCIFISDLRTFFKLTLCRTRKYICDRFLSEWTKKYDSLIRYFYKSMILVEFVYVSVEPTLEKKSEGGRSAKFQFVIYNRHPLAT